MLNSRQWDAPLPYDRPLGTWWKRPPIATPHLVFRQLATDSSPHSSPLCLCLLICSQPVYVCMNLSVCVFVCIILPALIHTLIHISVRYSPPSNLCPTLHPLLPQGEEIFLDMFEDEYRSMTVSNPTTPAKPLLSGPLPSCHA